jgi:hypothetical protein
VTQRRKLHRNVYRSQYGRGEGWIVILKRRGRKRRQYFRDADHGGARGSEAAALRWRDQQIAKLPPPVLIKMHDSRCRSGIVGVFRVVDRTRKGTRIARWVAGWNEPGGRYHKRTFSVAKYGEERAFDLARALRRAVVREILSRRGMMIGSMGRHRTGRRPASR